MTTKNHYAHGHSGAWQGTFGVVRRASHWLLVVALIPLGAVIGATALLATNAATSSREHAAVVGVLTVMLFTGGLSWLAMRGISRGRWLPGVTSGMA